jgi:16S rRNA (cytidine1402-2'-O)-methyltransferase
MLYIVSTPIGNPDDITLRALSVLKDADMVICEERGAGSRLLHYYKIENTLVDLNEHTERELVPELIARLQRGETLALISDHGTPLLSDPGAHLTEQAIAGNIPIRAVPGASSLLAALVVSGLEVSSFRFVGFLPAKREARSQALRRLRQEHDAWIVFDAPYRLAALLADLERVLGPDRRMVVACDLTMPSENIVRGTTGFVLKHFQKSPFKGEFVVMVAGQK